MHDVLARRKLWLPIGIRPIVTSTGSHQRTCVFGTLTMKGRQLFRQYDEFNQHTFLDYLKQVRKGLGKVIMFTDGARPHRSKKVEEWLEENKDAIRMVYLPKGSPQFNAVEECWRQGKCNLLPRYCSGFPHLKQAISNFYRTRRFNLDVKKYLFRSTE